MEIHRPTRQSPIENSDGTNSEMILTNEITTSVKHTESVDINEDYMKLISELTVSTEAVPSSPSPSAEWSSSSELNEASKNETDTTNPYSKSSLPTVVNVISV